MKKMESSCRAIVLKLSKKVHFLQFCADRSKKSESMKAIYIYASERSRYFQKMVLFIMLIYCFRDIKV